MANINPMKKLISLAFIICSYACVAQNYQCLQYGPINYFLNGNGYIRAMRIDSMRASGSDTIYYPYHTQRRSYSPCYMLTNPPVDSNGGSWLGKNVIKQADGTFLFDNMWNDTVIIKTQAVLGDTWSFFNDTTVFSYKATVTAVDTMTVLGSLDSIKKITIEADSAGMVNTLDPVNNFQIVLSKNHGFVKAIDLYTFPYHRPDSVNAYRQFFDYYLDLVLGNISTADLTCFLYLPNLPDTVNSIFHLFPLHNPTMLEINNFSVGDVLEWGDYYYLGSSGYHSEAFLDTIYSVTTGAYSTFYTTTEHTNTTDFSVSGLSTTTTFSAGHGTSGIYADTSQLFDLNKLPEEWGSSYFYNYFRDSTILQGDPGSSPCSADIYVVNVDYKGEFLGGDMNAMMPITNYSYGIGYGQTGIYDYNYTLDHWRQKSYIYIDNSGNECGGFARLIAAAVKNVNPTSNEVNIFPNPAHDKLNIVSTGGINEVSVCDLLGQVFLTGNYSQDKLEIDVSALPAGLYFIKINGYETRKFVKE